jgi:hypothetical protein
MLLAALALALTVGAAPAAADSLAGSWKITGDVMGNPVVETCTFRQTAAVIAGTCASEAGEFEVAGELKDGKISFWHAGGDYNGTALTMLWTIDTMTPTELRGTFVVKPFDAPGTFTAVPAPAKP